MDVGVLQDLLKAIKDAVSGARGKDDDIALPTFDPATSDSGAESWCAKIEALSREFGWSGIAAVAKAGKALKGSALVWYESWDPTEGRSWTNFRTELTDLYPEKKNLSEKLQKAVLYSSDTVDSYCEYAREKIRLFKSTRITFTEAQLIELVCGSITDVNVRMASFNSSIKTTSELISLFSSYVKVKKRSSEQSGKDFGHLPKRPRLDNRSNDVNCYSCGKRGHTKTQCFKRDIPQTNSKESHEQKSREFNKWFCSFCKKPGHTDSICKYKPKSSNNAPAKNAMQENNTSTSKEINFLEEQN